MRCCRGGRENGQRGGIEVGRSRWGGETAGAAEEKSEEGEGGGRNESWKLGELEENSARRGLGGVECW